MSDAGEQPAASIGVADGRAADGPAETGVARQYSAPAVELACQMLRYLAGARDGRATMTELATQVGTNKTTALRVLRTLEREGFVRYEDRDRRFGLGTYLAVLGDRAADSGGGLLAAALPVLAPAADATGFTCVLVHREDADHIAFVAREEPDNPIRIAVSVGLRFPVTAGSHGKVFLSALTREGARRVVTRLGLPLTSSAPSENDVEDYLSGLDVVRRDGYGVSLEEHVPGLAGVAAPIRDSSGEIVMTLSSIAIATQVDRDRATEVGEILVGFSDSVSHSLGWRAGRGTRTGKGA